MAQNLANFNEEDEEIVYFDDVGGNSLGKEVLVAR
jgi:hypothetical protein